MIVYLLCFLILGRQLLHINLLPSELPRSPVYQRKLFLDHARTIPPNPAPIPSYPPDTWIAPNYGTAPASTASPKDHGSVSIPPVTKHHRRIQPLLPPSTFSTPQGQDCDGISCSEPLTLTPIGSPCACVYPIQIAIDLDVPPFWLFTRIPQLEVEVAGGTFLKQSQVKIMGADAGGGDQQKTRVTIYLVPLDEKFDNMTALLIFDRFWQKKIPIDTSIFGDYEVIYVQYPGLPSCPPSASGVSLRCGPRENGSQNPLAADVPIGKSKKRSPVTVFVVVLSTFALILVCSGVIYIILRHRCLGMMPRTISPVITPSLAKRPGIKPVLPSSFASSRSVSLISAIVSCPPTLKTFSLGELEKATYGFSSQKLLGEGGFGRVYHGIMEDGSEVAVKLLTSEDHNKDGEFTAEVEMLSRLHHRNVVKLIGICIEAHTQGLVYELVRNGSVESHLHGVDKNKGPLDWDTRMKIALGAARALAYLHEDSNPRVIHRDFKASNILLLEDFTPKVSDFGLAKEASEGSHHISTRVMGTFGYVAPEYAMTGHLVVKSDVYSYGVVLLELLTGRKPVYMQDQSPENLVTWARPLLTSSEGLEQLVDPALGNNYDFENVAKVAAIASMCVHLEASQRPFMGEVVQALKLICNNSDVALEDSYSQRETSSCPGSEYKVDLCPEASWWNRSPPHRDCREGNRSSLTMETFSDLAEDLQRPHSASSLVGRMESTSRLGCSGPLRTKRQKTAAFYRLKGSVSEHGHVTRHLSMNDD